MTSQYYFKGINNLEKKRNFKKFMKELLCIYSDTKKETFEGDEIYKMGKNAIFGKRKDDIIFSYVIVSDDDLIPKRLLEKYTTTKKY